MATAKKTYTVKFETQSGTVTTTHVMATSTSEAKNIVKMRSNTKRVIAVLEGGH